MLEFDLNKILTLKAVSYYDRNGEIKFDPPVYEQRYAAVIKVLQHEYWQENIKKVIDFGCSEMKLLTLLKRNEGIEHILEIDIDEDILKSNTQRARPLLSDYIGRRKRPLRVDVYKGSVDAPVNCIKNTDAVIAVELIEHLYPDAFEGLPFNIFGFIRPKLVIITTPNVEFNVLFKLNSENGFRHYDHKFEWTRSQFKDWCHNICRRFRNYTVSITGIGKGPPTERHYGRVSQMAVFVRKDILGLSLLDKAENSSSLTNIKDDEEYKLIFSVEFPYNEDNRSYEEKILEEAKYHIERYRGMNDLYWNIEKNIYEIPIEKIFDFTHHLTISKDELKSVLLDNGYKIENDLILIEEEMDDDSNDSNSLDNDNENTSKETQTTCNSNMEVEKEESSWD